MTGFKWTHARNQAGFSFEPSEQDAHAMNVATTTFREMCIAVDREDKAAVDAHWEAMVTELGEESDPLGLLVCVGVIFNAFVMRCMMGDPDPLGEPTGTTAITLLATDKSTGAIVDAPVEHFAAVAIVHACNWEWSQLNDLMHSRKDELTNEFLSHLAGCLLSMFVGVGGVETAGWGEST